MKFTETSKRPGSHGCPFHTCSSRASSRQSVGDLRLLYQYPTQLQLVDQGRLGDTITVTAMPSLAEMLYERTEHRTRHDRSREEESMNYLEFVLLLEQSKSPALWALSSPLSLSSLPSVSPFFLAEWLSNLSIQYRVKW